MMRAAIFLLSMTSLLACADHDDYPNATGDMVGYIKLANNRGTSRNEHDHIKVELTGRVNRTVETNENGKFEFKKIPAGSYTITASKNGYDEYQQDAIIHLGGSVNLINFPASSILMAPKSPNRIADWSAEVLTISNNNTFLDHYLKIRLSFEAASYNSNSAIVLFISDKPGVSAENYTGFLLANQLDYAGNDFYEIGFYLFGVRPVKGVTQYARVYGYNGATPYKDIETGKDVFPSLGEGSTELTFTY